MTKEGIEASPIYGGQSDRSWLFDKKATPADQKQNPSLVYHSLRFGYDVPQGGEARIFLKRNVGGKTTNLSRRKEDKKIPSPKGAHRAPQ